ncbi:hypothetical protein [Sediminicoccus sp. KRV36]|uniref:hypothetical protein n=1 Tax=Sediminicoccus sp. KRV36 TaxID=3133721 RepID=UPI00200CD55F|nr:hypothetical protein [Sediminicoccus rosea]UPY39079.1 hypothetical protein LHU95_10415 [Sediminicoccus rosea]
MPLIALLRQGMVLSLGWVVCAAMALTYVGFFWALLLLIIWAALLVRFQRSTVEHAKSIAKLQGTKP